jgi:DNA mismatch repair protein MutS
VNVHLDATEHADGIIFLHAVKEGPADRSYGLQVAQLAGVPREVIVRARQYLVGLENQRDRRRPMSPQGELPLMTPMARAATPEDESARALAAAVADLNPDELSPKAALDALYRLRSLLKS